MNIVSHIEQSTFNFLETVSKSERKKIGQFFTPIKVADYMAGLSRISMNNITILDAGAGSGILATNLIQYLVNQGSTHIINIDLFENNPVILPILIRNMEYIKNMLTKKSIVLEYNVISENFITYNHLAWTGLCPLEKYDIVISNPPYKKIGKQDTESKIMLDIVYGQPNLYFLFMAMASRLLKPNGELIFIVPRSFSSGLYFTKFRKWFLREMKITNLHLFNSRKAVFKKDSILQETIIIKAIKQSKAPEFIDITQSDCTKNIANVNSLKVPYSTCVQYDKNSFIYLPTCEEDIYILDFINNWDYTLINNGYKMKTGTVVYFRAKEWLKKEESDETIPLLWAYNFNGSKVNYPIISEGKPQFLINCEKTKSLSMPINNYLLIKRFTSKEETRRLQCVMFVGRDFIKHPRISTENHLNYITKTKGSLSENEMYGLFVIINSTIFDKYFRILNGSTQVNSNEINSIPFPSKKDILEIGKIARSINTLEVLECDEILNHKYNRNKNTVAI